jgi:hypothetical protein
MIAMGKPWEGGRGHAFDRLAFSLPSSAAGKAEEKRTQVYE